MDGCKKINQSCFDVSMNSFEVILLFGARVEKKKYFWAG